MFYPQIKKVVCFSFLLLLFSVVRIAAQEARTEVRAVAVPAPATYTIAGTGAGYGEDEEDDTKVTGATVRGRVVYEDTNRPVRYALVMLSNAESYSYGKNFIKTDENGEFVFKNVKEGKYIPVVKGAGILYEYDEARRYSASSENKKEADEREIAVSGLGEFHVAVRARRGAAVTGRIVYADGEPAVGVRVQVLQKRGETFLSISEPSSGPTDDRGIYRIAGLPGGVYIVRVIEPGSHGPNKPNYEYSFRDEQNSVMRTYFPEGDTSKGARQLDIPLGVEQSGVDITIPERQRFTISGKIIRKRDNEPLAKFNVSFVSLATDDTAVRDLSSIGRSIDSNKAGEWSLRNLPKGKYRVSFSQGYVPHDEKKQKPERYPTLFKDVEITDKDITDLVFEVPTAASVSGTITVEGGKAFPTGYVRFMAVNTETGETKFDEGFAEDDETKQNPGQKKFRLGELKEGKYNLSMSNTDYFVKSVSGASGVTGSAIEVKEGETVTGLRVVLSGEVGTLKGRVANASADDAAFAVLVKPGTTSTTMPGNSRGGRVGPGGEFELKWAPGEYVLFIMTNKTRPRTEAEVREWFDKQIREGTRVTLKAGEITNAVVNVPG